MLPTLPTPTRFASWQQIPQYIMGLVRRLTAIHAMIDSWPLGGGIIVTITDSGNADTDITVSHTLGRRPTIFIVTDINKAGVVYRGTGAWTASQISLRCSQANATFSVFLS